MIGGLWKSASRTALVAAAGLFVGGVAMPSAKAADLGGDCCADLEERVAELEATTARKGNRKVSLTVSGQVNQAILYWDDGGKTGTIIGHNNNNSTSRFRFTGDARITPKVKAGFLFEFEWGSNTTASTSQLDEDGKIAYFGVSPTVTPAGCTPIGAACAVNGVANVSNNGNNQDSVLEAIQANFWVEDSVLGRVTLGRTLTAGVVNTGSVDLAGTTVVASGSWGLINGGFFLRNSAGALTALQWGKLGDPAANQGRQEALRYDSAAMAGFIFSASVGEAGDTYGAMLRYAGEFSGVRIAAGIGYENIQDKQTGATLDGIYEGASRPKVEAWGAALSLLHVPTGLFAQGHFMQANFSDGTDTDSVAAGNQGFASAGHWNSEVVGKKDATQWMVQAGLSKNFFGLGVTAVYGEYGKGKDWGAGEGTGRSYAATGVATANLVSVAGVTGTDLTIYGIGIVQNIDAAATELYLGWRHFSADLTCTGAGVECTGAAGGAAKSLSLGDIDVVTAGARIKF